MLQTGAVLHAWEGFARALNALAPAGVDRAFQTLPGTWTTFQTARALVHGTAVRPACTQAQSFCIGQQSGLPLLSFSEL